jgi:hypothetical protein
VGTNRLVWTLKNATGTIEVATTKVRSGGSVVDGGGDDDSDADDNDAAPTNAPPGTAARQFNFTVRATNAGLVSLVGSVDIFNTIAETLETNNDLSTSIPVSAFSPYPLPLYCP